jgi:hypothetical protein
VAQTTNPLSAALEAGKQAYSEEKRRTDTSTVPERPTYPVEGKSLNAPKTDEQTEG